MTNPRAARRGTAMIMVLVALMVSLVFGTFLMRRSVHQRYEKTATRERIQLELLCLSVIDAAKLKIKAHPTEFYEAFRFRHDVPLASRTDALYQKFLSDLRLDVLDESLRTEGAAAGATMTASVTEIERLGITRRAPGLAPGYVEDFIRITASATSRIGSGLTSGVVMQKTFQIAKREDR